MRVTRIIFPILVALYCFAAACSSPQQMGTTTAEGPAESLGTAQVRFIHAIPDAPNMEIWIGNSQVAPNVGFRQWTEWVAVEAGEKDVALRRGEFTELSDTYTFQADRRYLIIAWGMMTVVGNDVAATFLITEEEEVRSGTEDAWIRFANLMAEGEALGLVITTEGGWNLIFPNQPIGTLSEYKRGPLYQNSFEIIPARDTSLPAIHEFEQYIQVGIQFTFVITGRQRDDQMEVFAVTDYRE